MPYARPPIGDLRFKQAQKPFDFDGVYDATSFKPICPQMIRFEKEQESEDCLYLNIFFPFAFPRLLNPSWFFCMEVALSRARARNTFTTETTSPKRSGYGNSQLSSGCVGNA